MTRFWAFCARKLDTLLALGLFFGYLGLLLSSAGSLGFTRDEGFYFEAARAYESWFELLFRHPSLALSRAAVDRYWSVNHEHPALIKSLFALSHRWLGAAFSDVSTSFRLPGMLLSSAAVTLTFVWGRRVLGRSAGLVAALSFAFLPRVFFHAHLACFDMPVCAIWLFTSYAYARSLGSARSGWAVVVGVAFGCLLDTKHNAWLFPLAVAAHFALMWAFSALRERPAGAAWWRRLPPAWLSMLVLGPLVFYALWPWIWRDTLPRLRAYVAFHTNHDYYNMEFLGHTYWKPPMPHGYAWLMTLATVPLVTLVLFGIGALSALADFRSPTTTQDSFAPRSESVAPSQTRSDYALWAVCLAVSYAPWWSSSTPIFGGTKHWLTAYPYLCLFAGLGFSKVKAAVWELLPRLGNPFRLMAEREALSSSVVAACVLAGPLAMTLHAHPFGLSAYTPLVGGAPGAASLGLNRSFWGYTTESLVPFINQSAPRHGVVYLHDTAQPSFAMFQEDGRLRADLRATLSIPASDIALYHHEPHMSRVESQIWLEYGSVSPDVIATYDGVPIAWAYARRPPR